MSYQIVILCMCFAERLLHATVDPDVTAEAGRSLNVMVKHEHTGNLSHQSFAPSETGLYEPDVPRWPRWQLSGSLAALPCLASPTSEKPKTLHSYITRLVKN